MFDAKKIADGLSSVTSFKQLVALLAASTTYTFGDKFIMANYKLGNDKIAADEAHPGWTWTPLSGRLVSTAACWLLQGSELVIFATGTRAAHRDKPVLCMWVTYPACRDALETVLMKSDGGSTIGAALADYLGYTDWCTVSGATHAEQNVYTGARLDVNGVQPVNGTWAGPVGLVVPDDGAHSYTTVYDPYSGLALMDDALGLPTMMLRSWDADKNGYMITMCKSTYDADYQNTTDIAHLAIRQALASTDGTLATDVAGLKAANAAIYAAIANTSVFGSKFSQVVEVEANLAKHSQYIPRN